MKLKKFIEFTGIWIYPILVSVEYYAAVSLQEWLKLPAWIYIIWVFVIPAFIPIIITNTNYRKWKKQGITEFGLRQMLDLQNMDEYHTEAYLNAAYPPIDKHLISNKPKDLVLGYNDEKYVCVPVLSDGLNGFTCGGVGSGKSTMILAWLLAMIYRMQIFEQDMEHIGRIWNFFVVDIKGEIYRRLTHMDGRYRANKHMRIQVIDPSNRDSFGWDALYLVHGKKVSETERLKAVNDITEALIPELTTSGENGNAAYFQNNAKKMLSGILYFYIKNYPDMSFTDIIKKITRTNLAVHLSEIVKEAEEKFDGITLDKLKGFVGKGDNTSIQDVESTMNQMLDVFSYPDIEYLLNNNPHKTSPAALDDGVTCIDLAFAEAMLATYQPIFRLITMQILRHCEYVFKETDDRHTILIIDEAFRVGKISGLENSMATMRNRHTSIMLLFQDISQMKALYGSISDTILNVCDLKIFLSGAGDKDTTEYVARMAGEYTAESRNYKKGKLIIPQSDVNYHEDRRAVVDGKSFMTLREKNEMVLFYMGQYFRFKKIRYWEDNILGPIYEAIHEEEKKEITLQ